MVVVICKIVMNELLWFYLERINVTGVGGRGVGVKYRIKFF